MLHVCRALPRLCRRAPACMRRSSRQTRSSAVACYDKLTRKVQDHAPVHARRTARALSAVAIVSPLCSACIATA